MNCRLSCSVDLHDPSLEAIAPAVATLTGFLRDQGVPDGRALAEFELAAAEAINNAIEHGCAGVSGALVEIRLELDPKGITLEVTDPSTYAGPEQVSLPPDDVLAEGGRGHFLIENLSTSTHHTNEDGRHRLSLRKDLEGSGWEPDPGRQDRVLQAMTEEVGGSYELINALIGLGELVASASVISDFLGRALARVCELTGAPAAYVRMVRPEGLALAASAGSFSCSLQPLISPEAGGVEVEVFRTGEEVTVTSPAELALADPLCGCLQAAFIAPIFHQAQRRGLLVLGLLDPEAPFFKAVQLQVARVVGEYLGIVTAMHELQERRESEQRALRELEIAAEIQLSLMPQDFLLSPRLAIYGECRPALKAGGDYFDLAALPDGAVFAAIADVMGKGISAALLANMLRAAIRANLARAADPGDLLTVVNQALTDDLSHLGMFITAAVVWINPATGELRHASAGHPSGLLQRHGGGFTMLEPGGTPVGVIGEAVYLTSSAHMGPGDTLYLHTDGLPEAASAAGSYFGEEGLEHGVAGLRHLTPRERVRALLEEVDRFTGHAPPTDDRTLVALELLPSP